MAGCAGMAGCASAGRCCVGGGSAGPTRLGRAVTAIPTPPRRRCAAAYQAIPTKGCYSKCLTPNNVSFSDWASAPVSGLRCLSCRGRRSAGPLPLFRMANSLQAGVAASNIRRSTPVQPYRPAAAGPQNSGRPTVCVHIVHIPPAAGLLPPLPRVQSLPRQELPLPLRGQQGRLCGESAPHPAARMPASLAATACPTSLPSLCPLGAIP